MSGISVSGVSADSGENTRFIILISCVATIGGFLFGFDSGVINGTVDGLKETFNSSSAGTGFEVASMLLGCAIGAFLPTPLKMSLPPASHTARTARAAATNSAPRLRAVAESAFCSIRMHARARERPDFGCSAI